MKKLTKNMALQFIREAGDWALEEAHEFSFGCWNLNLYKTSNYAPYIYELWGHSATTEAMISRHYKSVEAALLHMCNDFNENAAVRNKYQTIEEALAPGGAFTVETPVFVYHTEIRDGAKNGISPTFSMEHYLSSSKNKFAHAWKTACLFRIKSVSMVVNRISGTIWRRFLLQQSFLNRMP